MTTRVTANHRYLNCEGDWTPIGEFNLLDEVVWQDGPATITNVDVLDSRPVIYNLHMDEGPPTYLANGVVVHNANKGAPNTGANAVSTQGTEDKLDELNRNIKQLASEMKSMELQTEYETIARVASDGEQNRISDNDPTT